jgi:hypothetical protein
MQRQSDQLEAGEVEAHKLTLYRQIGALYEIVIQQAFIGAPGWAGD